MKTKALRGIRAIGLMACVLATPYASTVAAAQDSTTTQLLGKAHALEVRGRMDMAKQTWSQVLLMDGNNPEALAGMARAAKSEGKIEEANRYLAKLRSINPSDPNIAKVENMGTAQDQNVLLTQAGKLSQQGQYARAMSILKQVYGNNPPPGDAALSYYQTEAATDDTRPQAIAGLRAMADHYPDDPRYEISLGKILTYNPRTRAEGRKLLSKHQNDQEASEALRQALTWDQANPQTAGEIKSYLQKHPDQGLQNALNADQRQHVATVRHQAAQAQLTPEQKAAQVEKATMGREVQQAYTALNAKRYSEAEQRFNVLLAANPNDAKALAGLGYIRMQQANFAGAISYLSQAQQNGDTTPGLEKALSDARFYYTMRSASGALTEDDLPTAIQQFEQALQMRPNDPSAMQGLAGTLLKAQQPEPAISIYTTLVKSHPSEVQGWKGLFLAYASANQFDMAIGTDRRMPPSVRAGLMRDPDYLRTLASVYAATNREGEAQRVLAMALQLPFPANARGLRADVQMQYAALLEAAGHHEQAAGLYREVLAADSNNTNAWVGLIQTEHTTGQDLDAFGQLGRMPPANYQAAMQEPGFATTVASIYMAQGHDDLAQNVLEQFLQAQTANNQKPFVAAQVTLANLYLKHNDTAHAFPLFENILTNNPDRPDAWKGLLNSLHATGHNQEALAEIQQMPPDMRRQLEADPDYLQTVAGIYADLGHPQDAMRFLDRAKQHYRAQGVNPPAANDVQTAWLLFNTGNDPALYKQLMSLGSRPDLTDDQRRTVQTIWASWAVRRSQLALANNNPKRAIAILNAAAQSFPGNPGVLKALGSGYAAAGLPKEAIQIFKAQDLSSGTAADYRAAVGAALSANDQKDAEVWLRFGLEQYPRDAQLLGLAAKFETARGNAGRAADYYRASLNAMPGPDPSAELAEEMAHAPLTRRLPRSEQPTQDLATLLAAPDAPIRSTAPSAYGDPYDAPVPRPYLPSYGGSNVQAPVIVNRAPTTQTVTTYRSTPSSSLRSGTETGRYAPQSSTTYPSTTTIITPDNSMSSDSGAMTYPNYSGPNAMASPQQMQADPNAGGSYTAPRTRTNGAKSTLGSYQYVPQSEAIAKPLPGTATSPYEQATLHLTQSPESVAKYGPYRTFIPGEPMPSEQGSEALTAEVVFPVARKVVPVNKQNTDGTPRLAFLPVSHGGTEKFFVTAYQSQQGSTQQEQSNPFANFGVQAPAKEQKKTAPAPHPIHLTPKPVATQHDSAAPIVVNQTPVYVPPPIFIPGVTDTAANAPANQPERTITLAAPVRQEAVPVRALTPQQRVAAARRAAQIRNNQVNSAPLLEGTSHPPTDNYNTDSNGEADMHTVQFSTAPFNPSATQGAQVPKSQAPDLTNSSSSQEATPGQQYPQPNTRRSSGTTTTTRRRSTVSRQQPRPSAGPLPAPVETAPMQAPQGTMNYPIYPQPLSNEGDPAIPGAYPLPAAPTDSDLRRQNVPPLRGYFDPRISNDPKEPLTEREQTELDLATIEASYSPWAGGTVMARYRSGRAGIDRLEALETPFEATFMLGKWARLSLIPKAVFLNTGKLVLDPDAVAAPLIGSLYATATSAPVQQFASGFGGEAQLVTNTFGLAMGYSPYGFPVANLIGRARWRPGNWHFTFYGGRDSVKETMLSYAGLRDPGSTNGAIWGGVVQSGGGIRFDVGDEKSGFYASGEGGELTGYHVLDNRKYDGTMGAYFRVKTWADYGSLNVGGTLFGEHFDHNERGQTYGNGGYFSPNTYFLAAVPITFNGHWKENLHYVINGSIGLQTFQEDAALYFPLDSFAQAGVPGCQPTTGVGCGLQVNSNTGANYSVDSQLSYHINDHWYVGGFLSANNTNNYNTIQGGVFARYTFRPQVQTVEYPTGLFPVEGFRPIRVP